MNTLNYNHMLVCSYHLALWKDIFKNEISKIPSHINISKSTFVANFDDGDIYFDPKLIRVPLSHKERIPFFSLIELYY